MNECRKNLKVQRVTKILHRIIYFVIFLYHIIRFKFIETRPSTEMCVCVGGRGGVLALVTAEFNTVKPTENFTALKVFPARAVRFYG